MWCWPNFRDWYNIPLGVKERNCNRGTKDSRCCCGLNYSLFCYGESVRSSASDNVIHTFKALCRWKQLKFARRAAVCIFCYYFTAVITFLVHSGVWNTKHWFWVLCCIHRCKNCYVKGCVTIMLLENCLGLNISTGEWADPTNNFYFSHRIKNNQSATPVFLNYTGLDDLQCHPSKSCFSWTLYNCYLLFCWSVLSFVQIL